MKNGFMKIGLPARALLVLAAAGWAVQADAAEGATALITSKFDVEGMTCGGCVAGVKLTVKRLDGVESVEASYKLGTAEVVHDPDRVTTDEIVAAIDDLGYSAELVEEAEEGATEGDS